MRAAWARLASVRLLFVSAHLADANWAARCRNSFWLFRRAGRLPTFARRLRHRRASHCPRRPVRAAGLARLLGEASSPGPSYWAPPKQLLAVSEKLGADFASLDGFALRFTSHRLRRPLQAADLLARLVKRRSLHCVPGRPIETACGCFARAGELHRPVQLSATKARRNQTPVPDCPAETACGCFRGPEQLQAVRSREMSKEREID